MEEVSWALKYWLEVMSYVLLNICTVPLAMYTENRQTLSPTSENKRKLIIILISWPFISYLPLKYTVCLSQSTNIKKKQTYFRRLYDFVWVYTLKGRKQLAQWNTTWLSASKGIIKLRVFLLSSLLLLLFIIY